MGFVLAVKDGKRLKMIVIGGSYPDGFLRLLSRLLRWLSPYTMYKTLIFIPLCMSLQHVTHTEDSWRWEHDFKAHISNHRHLYFKALFHFVFPIILDVHCPSIVQMCFSVWRWIDNQYLVATCGDLWRLPCLPEAPISLTHPLRLRDKAIWTTKIG